MSTSTKYVESSTDRGERARIVHGSGAKEKIAGLRNNLVGEIGGKPIGEESLEKSLGDASFKILEDELEAQAIIHDIRRS